MFKDIKRANEILNSRAPKRIKELGRLVKDFDEDIWSANKENIVLQGNILKFSQNLRLKEYLNHTTGKILVEASPYDRVWGVGLKSDCAEICDPRKWKGKNLLGFILMETRDRLKLYD